MRAFDRAAIYALSMAVVGLVALLLLCQKTRKVGNTGENAPSDEWVSKLNRNLTQAEKDLENSRFNKTLNRIGVNHEQ